MIVQDEKLSKKFPGAKFESGAVIGERCRIDAGCEISAETKIQQNVALCSAVQIHGEVTIEMGAVIRENVTLVGPLIIKEHAFIGHDSVVGATREGESKFQPTIVGAYVRIGKEVEIIGGVSIGDGARIRAKSKVIGDVPANGLASHSPAILEGYICPSCGRRLKANGTNPHLVHAVCPHCHQHPIIMNAKNWSELPRHVLLPNNQIGEMVSTLGDDPRWLDEWEIR